MPTLNVFTRMAAHPWLAALTIIWIVLVLHLPYRVEQRRDRRGRIHAIYQSLIYRYEYGPTYERLDYRGLRRAQHAILELLGAAWAALHGDVLRRFVDALRQRFDL